MNKTHDQCKHFGFNSCPLHEDDVMKRANQEVQRYYGGKVPQMLPFPTKEEINALCENCESFTLK